MPEENKYIDGVPVEGVADELPPEDRGGAGPYKWLQFRSYWGEHPQRNEVRVLDKEICLTDTFSDDGRLKGGKIPDSSGKGKKDAYEQGLMGAMIAGIVSVALGGFALVQPWFQAFAFEFPADSGNRLEVGEVAGTAVLYGMVAVVVFALAFAARSFLKDRGLSRAADLALSVVALLVIFVSFANLGGDKLAPTLDLIPNWSSSIADKAKAQAKVFVDGGELGTELRAQLALEDEESLRDRARRQQLEPRQYDARQKFRAMDQAQLVEFLMDDVKKKVWGGKRCGERDDKGRRTGECGSLRQVLTEATAQLDLVAKEVAQTDREACMLDKNEVDSWLNDRRAAKKGSKAPQIPGADCTFSIGKHGIAKSLKTNFDPVRSKAWAGLRSDLAEELVKLRVGLERRRMQLDQVGAGATEGHEVDAAKIEKRLETWKTAAMEQFKAVAGEKRLGIETYYDGGVGCYWMPPTEEQLAAAKKAREPKPEPKAVCSQPSREHAEYAELTDEAKYKAFRGLYGDLTQKRTHHPKDPAAKPPANDKPEPPDLHEEDRRSLQIATIDVQDDLEVDPKALETIIKGLERRAGERTKVFTSVTVSDAGADSATRKPFFVTQAEWIRLVAKAEEDGEPNKELDITCKEIEIASPDGKPTTRLSCSKPEELGKKLSGVGADLLTIWRVYKHPVNGPTLQLRLITKKDGMADYTDAQMVGDLSKITEEASYLLDRTILAWAMNQRRKAEERARSEVTMGVSELKDRVSEAARDLGRTTGAYTYATKTLLGFAKMEAKDSAAALEKFGSSFVVERRVGYFWIMFGLVICLLGLGINRSTKEVVGENLVNVTGDGADVRLNLAADARGGLAVWDGTQILTGGGLGDRGSSTALQLRDGEAAAFSIGGIAYTVRYISSNLAVPPGEFEDATPDAALLAAIPQVYQPSETISPAVFTTADANTGGAASRRLQVEVFWGPDLFYTNSFGSNKASVAIGTGAKADIDVTDPAFGEIGENFTIASFDGNGHVIHVPGNSNAEASINGEIQKKDQLSSSGRLASGDFRLNEGEVFALKAGALTLVFRYVATDSIPVVPFLQRFDWLFANIAAASLLIHLALIAIFVLTPVDPNRLSEDLFKNPNRFVQIILKEPDKKEKKKEKLDLSGAKDGGKHKDKEGKFGKKDKPKKDALASKKGAPTVDPNKRERDRKIAYKAGLLGLTGSNAAVSNVFGPGGLGTGINNALGGLRGSEFGDAGGAGGLGYRGTGAGGGGNALGIGGLGSGTGRGTGGLGSVDLGGRGRGTTRILPGRTVIKGSLSREEIARVIRRHLNQIKYCYEKELSKKPNLKGKVTTKFIIAGTGRVKMSKIYQTTMNHSPTEDCINRIIKMMKFPQPRGGGIVQVVYPFMFQKSG